MGRNKKRGGANKAGAQGNAKPAGGARPDGAKLPWFCKSCVSPKSGEPWRNAGALLQCSKCHLHKGVCHGGNVSTPPPGSQRRNAAKDANDSSGGTRSPEETKLQKQLEETTKELEEALAAGFKPNAAGQAKESK